MQALLALGEDYMRSGLLDRAETVFSDLAQIDQRAPQALRHLIGIYQAERDWDKAIENATRYRGSTGEPMGKLIAQFECELADASAPRATSTPRATRSRAPMPPTRHRCAPASSKAGSRLDAGNDAAAIRAFERAARHDPDYLPEILPPLLACYERGRRCAPARAPSLPR